MPDDDKVSSDAATDRARHAAAPAAGSRAAREIHSGRGPRPGRDASDRRTAAAHGRAGTGMKRPAIRLSDTAMEGAR